MSSSANEAGSSQNETLFMRGKAMSGAPIISGTNQLPKPPIIAGITMKNTMMRPWPVTNTLNMWPLAKYCIPGSCSSMRMPTDRAPPIRPRHDGEQQVHRADVLVVGREQPAPQPVGRVRGRGRGVFRVSLACHVAYLRIPHLAPPRAVPSRAGPRRRPCGYRTRPLSRRPSSAGELTAALRMISRAFLRSLAFSAAAQSLNTSSFTTRTAIGMKA